MLGLLLLWGDNANANEGLPLTVGVLMGAHSQLWSGTLDTPPPPQGEWLPVWDSLWSELEWMLTKVIKPDDCSLCTKQVIQTETLLSSCVCVRSHEHTCVDVNSVKHYTHTQHRHRNTRSISLWLSHTHKHTVSLTHPLAYHCSPDSCLDRTTLRVIDASD